MNWYLPDNLIDTKNYIAEGSMHNFSYLGELIGLIAGVIYNWRKKGSGNREYGFFALGFNP